jgi:hypothetical protein
VELDQLTQVNLERGGVSQREAIEPVYETGKISATTEDGPDGALTPFVPGLTPTEEGLTVDSATGLSTRARISAACPIPATEGGHPNDQRAEALLTLALHLACEIRDDTAAVHRQVSQLGRADLEALCCVLAACVPLDRPIAPWWQPPARDSPAVILERRRVLNEALAARGGRR